MSLSEECKGGSVTVWEGDEATVVRLSRCAQHRETAQDDRDVLIYVEVFGGISGNPCLAL